MCTYSIVDYTVVDKFLYSICGSPFPEVLSLYNADSRHLISGGHPVQCTASYLCIVQTADIWSLGVTLYSLVLSLRIVQTADIWSLGVTLYSLVLSICIVQTADIWSLGVTLYSLVFGKVPFHDENILALYNKIRTQDFQVKQLGNYKKHQTILH